MRTWLESAPCPAATHSRPIPSKGKNGLEIETGIGRYSLRVSDNRNVKIYTRTKIVSVRWWTVLIFFPKSNWSIYLINFFFKKTNRTFYTHPSFFSVCTYLFPRNLNFRVKRHFWLFYGPQDTPISLHSHKLTFFWQNDVKERASRNKSGFCSKFEWANVSRFNMSCNSCIFVFCNQ